MKISKELFPREYTPIISWSLWMKQDVHVISPWLLPGVRFVCVRCVYMKRVMVFIKSHYEPRWSRSRIARAIFNTSTWARQKLHRFAATKVVGVNGLEKVTTAQMAIRKFLCFSVVSFFLFLAIVHWVKLCFYQWYKSKQKQDTQTSKRWKLIENVTIIS